MYNGQGTYTYANGNKYVGEYKDGFCNGQGTATFANGDKYVGKWKDGFRNGHGTYTFANSDKYVGEFKDGERNGRGSFTFSDGRQYIGEWKDNDRNGQGALTFISDEWYVGKFKDNKFNGQGTFSFSNGNKYVGEFKDNERNGQGVVYNFGGVVIQSGFFEKGVLVNSFSLDKNRFPISQLTQITAPTPSQTTAERDRLLEEVEAERKKRQELEEQLRVAQQSTQPNKQPVTSGVGRRVALVIGNATYKVNPLKNPANDSTDMARSLRSVGFDVIEANNTTLAQMREVTRRFADKLGNSDVGLVYYSGHGVEVKGKNYLIPVNADIKREYEVVDQAFDASQFLEMMDNIRGPNNKRVNILIVDACRNNELQKSWRSTNNGLARMDAPGGTFISFATAPGRVAADGTGRNSPYTKHLLQALKQPNVPIEQVFKVVRRNVMEETKGEQIPWENSSLVGDFYFTVQR